MLSALRHRKTMQEVPHSIPDLFSERVHELRRALFDIASSDLAPNAQASATPGSGSGADAVGRRVTVDEGIAPPVSAAKPCVPVSRHTAPQ